MRQPTQRQFWKAVFVALTALSLVGVVSPSIIGLKKNLELGGESSAEVTPTVSNTPALAITPLSVRPVVSEFVTTPDRCPALTPAPRDQPVRACDFAKTAVYELSPEALQVELTNVDSVPNLLTGAESVQMSLTPESARRFAEFTALQVGKQIAFVRGGTVVWGPKIASTVDQQVLQMPSDLTPEEAGQVVDMLREAE